MKRVFSPVDHSGKLCRALRHGPSNQTSQDQAESIGVGGSLGRRSARGQGLWACEHTRCDTWAFLQDGATGQSAGTTVCDGTWMAKTPPRPATELVHPPNTLVWPRRPSDRRLSGAHTRLPARSSDACDWARMSLLALRGMTSGV